MPSQALSSDSLSTERPTLVAQKAPATPLDDMDSIVATYEQRIFRFHLVSIRDRDVAQTLTQDTFVRAWSARSNFRGDCSISTWLMRIALNLVRDHTRTDRFKFWKKVSDTAVDVSDISAHVPHRDSSLESRLIASEQMALVWESVAQLSERQRSIFLLRFLEELELSEIASITGLPISTVKTHLYRALATIRARHTAALKDSL
ncbi:RNA polymerase sigma factor [Tunturiibacter gelidoferens]|jgi:RNA polymerase sigma-70 factor, ECF subfamily|uniref:RNA polymerase sigma-70 factor (ECF subfamily) n=1 Tax=Tunturiibacter gelidiferens TaxID=3069689 RepID=A0A9X0QDQ2_9BACT|nr:sigma-70 family RNA polymerase sigma factor [Edaphobacter lichenicola]MBB5328393.1 RNA polymerase sigma-70 factor (ECF subfamily) [Edaphobacter lichenicola]